MLKGCVNNKESGNKKIKKSFSCYASHEVTREVCSVNDVMFAFTKERRARDAPRAISTQQSRIVQRTFASGTNCCVGFFSRDTTSFNHSFITLFNYTMIAARLPRTPHNHVLCVDRLLLHTVLRILVLARLWRFSCSTKGVLGLGF